MELNTGISSASNSRGGAYQKHVDMIEIKLQSYQHPCTRHYGETGNPLTSFRQISRKALASNSSG